jgi:protein O-GlcNAc transferase
MSGRELENAWRLQRAGRVPEAARIFAEMLRANPMDLDALYGLGMIHLESRHFAEADRLFAIAIRINSQSPELFYIRGCVLQSLSRNEDALASFTLALALKPDFAEARNNRGVTLLALKRYPEALACFDRVIAEKPGAAMVHNNRATALLALERYDEALASSETALNIDPNAADALFSRGSALAALGRPQHALTDFNRALVIDPSCVDALVHRGIILAQEKRHHEALASYNKALGIRPGQIDILYNRVNSLWALRRFADAVPDCEQILKSDPHYKYARGNLIYSRLQCADWRKLTVEKAAAVADLQAGLRSFQPLHAIAVCNSPDDLLKCSRIWVSGECPPRPEALWQGERYHHDRIRIAYVSADFGPHPVATLAAGVFENHDRTRFETVAISFGPEDNSGARDRMQFAFDRFIDVRGQSDAEAARQLREMEIDIAVDLMGFTQNARSSIFARRPAPVQVNYLGFPGSMGAPYIDYIVADKIVIPEAHHSNYDEKIAYLPHSCFPNDASRPIAERTPSRSEAGLPDKGFVFCSFNNLYKITPELFAVWMRLLSAIDGSVLWLSATNPEAVRNLKNEAKERGISGDRILFAPFLPSAEEHLARLRLADLFLDTTPYNAHATACDFLWAGVPIVTLQGASFAGRVGASLLSAIGVQTLIGDSAAEYEAIALRFARDPSGLTAVKRKLIRNRESYPLFDTVRFTRNLEAAYMAMWKRRQNGDLPASFAVEDVSAP